MRLASAVAVALLWALHPSPVAAQDGYLPVPGSPDVLLNPAHEGAVGSEFTQQCTGLPRPPGPGEVAWHFILPQSVLELDPVGSPTPGNIFDNLTVTFDSLGPVTLTTFGPPSDAHAYVYTPTDDTLETGAADILREVNLLRGNEPSFNLSHTCAGPPATTTTTTAPPTTEDETTTTVGGDTTTTAEIGPATSGADTTDPADASPTSVQSGTTAADPSGLPSTGSATGGVLLAGVALIGAGVLLVTTVRRRVAD
jgi:LPXTG-motif cell wall-anchored protein